MLSKGMLNSKLWIVTDMPSAPALQTGAFFIGMEEIIYTSNLSRIGLTEADVYLTSIVPTTSPTKEFGWFLTDADGKRQLNMGLAYLKESILSSKPNVILFFTRTEHAMELLLGVKDPDPWRGHILWSDVLNCKVSFTYHPGSVIRQRYVDKDEKPGQFEALLQLDLGKVKKEMNSRELNYVVPETHVHPSYSEAMDWLNELYNTAKVLSYDIETIQHSIIDCIGFSRDGIHGYCIPFYYPAKGKLIPYYSESETLDIWLGVRRLLQSNIPKVAQNAQYDNLVLWEYYKVLPRNLVCDTMILAHNMYCDLPKDLGRLISIYTNLAYHKYLNKTGTVEDHWIYNALDAVSTLHVYQGEIAEAQGLGVYEHYLNITHPSILPCLAMQKQGVNIDIKLKDAAMELEATVMEGIITRLDRVFPKPIGNVKKPSHKFNPNSPKQKCELFFDILKCKARKYKGKVSADEDTLEKLIEQETRPYVQTLLRACIAYKQASYMYGRLKTPLRNGRLHTKYDPAGTDTGRLNSKESDFGSGTNLQNAKKGVQRAMVIPG